jgi:hypothetical protein
MNCCWVLLLLLVALIGAVSGDVHECVNAARRLHRRTFYPPYALPPGPNDPPYVVLYNNLGLPVEPIEPCIVCEPVNVDCPVGCEELLGDFLSKCDGICLPDTYFFDPQNTMAGCFADHAYELNRQIERCGCSAAASLLKASFSFLLLLLLATLSIYLAM